MDTEPSDIPPIENQLDTPEKRPHRFSPRERLKKLTEGARDTTRRVSEQATSQTEGVKNRAQEAREITARKAAEIRDSLEQGESVRAAQERARQLATHTQELARRAHEDPIGTAHDLLEQSRLMREEAELHNKNLPRWRKFFASTAGKVVTTGIEMIPFGGDVLTFVNGLRGKNTLSGEKLDAVDRVIHIVAGITPGVPATPAVEVAKIIRRHIEEGSRKGRNKDQLGMANHARGVASAARDLKNIIRPPKK